MPATTELERARRAFAQLRWREALEALVGAEDSLDAPDLEILAASAALAGEKDRSVDAWTRAHHAWIDAGRPADAARCAFWIGFGFMNDGEYARGGGWLGRAAGLVAEAGDCVEAGYLMLPAGIQAAMQGDPEASLGHFLGAAEIAQRFGDRSLATMARMGQGRTLIRIKRVAEGAQLLDEVMVAVTAGEVTPHIVGDVYCTVIEGCHDMFDVRRAHEWTAALSKWCDESGDLVYRGRCLVHRVQLKHLTGDWPEAITEITQACDILQRPPPHPAVGEAFYERGEIFRLRGDLVGAEQAYHEAGMRGRSPQPGLALLRLAKGETAAAEAALRRALGETSEQVDRARLLPAYVEVALGAGDLAAARAAAEELVSIAHDVDAPLLAAHAAHASGSVTLAQADHERAIAELRKAATTFAEIDAPYDAARSRVLIGLACRALGDTDGCDLELETARRTFDTLGAAGDIAALIKLLGVQAAAGPLTAREVEVLRLVAAGKTNRAVAQALVISEKTVARHVANIFTKLGLASRSEATACAYEHGLV